MKVTKLTDLYSKQLENDFKNNEKIPENLLKNLGKPWTFVSLEKWGP